MDATLGRHLVLALGLLGGCDGGIPQPAEGKGDGKESKVDEEALARRKAEREAATKAKEDAADHLRAELERLCVVPDPMPKEAPTCEQVAQAHDDFVRRVGDAAAVTAWEAESEETTAMTIVRCTQAGSSKVALCQKNALDGAGAELLPHATDLLDTCITRFGKAGGDPGVVPPKPAG
jgi:hypothetical protein